MVDDDTVHDVAERVRHRIEGGFGGDVSEADLERIVGETIDVWEDEEVEESGLDHGIDPGNGDDDDEDWM
ncbi:hypothetical protein [Salinigranum sp. GCM10025319]|uniref:hypothetical protein n=1 Tax=Salinigranum sp. GCM10025319 TaxID=3252687 RepID=UPI00360AC216